MFDLCFHLKIFNDDNLIPKKICVGYFFFFFFLQCFFFYFELSQSFINHLTMAQQIRHGKKRKKRNEKKKRKRKKECEPPNERANMRTPFNLPFSITNPEFVKTNLNKKKTNTKYKIQTS